MAAQVKDAAWMEWVASLLGVASRQTCAAALPTDRYYCLLDELPVHLIPRRPSGLLHEDLHEPLFLNPNCLIRPASQLPDELISQPELVANFAMRGTVAWVRDTTTKSLLPFWLGSELESALYNLSPYQDARRHMTQKDCRILFAAGILRRDNAGHQARPASDLHDRLRRIYSDNNYVAFGRLIHPFHVAALRRYYRCLIRKGLIYRRDFQCPQRYAAHNEPVARFFHHQLTKVVSAIAGERVKPSYVYFASYQPGAELKKHTDREQCEFSVSFCLDFSPEPEDLAPWPLCLDTAQGPVKVHQALGDGLFYRGTRVPHYRSPLSEGRTSTSIFFHYVSENFSGCLD
jgi:hypothetical protein